MEIAIIGAGAVGKSIGGSLQLAGQSVHYLVRSEYKALAAANQFSMTIAAQEKTFTVTPLQVYRAPDKLPTVDLAIITVKTTENHRLSTLLNQCLKPETVLLVLQNGIGNEAYVAEQFPQHPIICGITSIGAVREGAENINIPFLGELRLAPYHSNSKPMIEKLSQQLAQQPTSPKVVFYESHAAIRWHKLLWNATFNPLSILFDCPTKTLVEHPPYRTIVNQVFEEIVAIANADGVVLSASYQAQLLKQTVSVADYYPSMYIDFKQHRPIEKTYIIDNLVSIAETYDIQAPCLLLIQRQLTLLLQNSP